MKDGRKILVDFSSNKSVKSVKKEDWVEIKAQLENYLKITNSKTENKK